MESPSPPQASSISSPYHQRQRLQLCLLHALNNLLQGEGAFTRSELDGIANGLSASEPWSPLGFIFRPHHNTITGNYDANVLLAALENRRKEVVWYDRRNSVSSLDLGDGEKKLLGIVLNQPTRRYGGLWKGRHWVAVRKVQGVWYNLDSDLAAPQPFLKGEVQVKEFLAQSLKEGAEALIVFEREEKGVVQAEVIAVDG